jgi:tRNA-Thr(GGU) m(6)t(6)A37 methyltransferase TsaA
LREIGTVHNSVTRRRQDGWESIDSLIVVAPEFTEGLLGLDGFSHALVLTWLHLIEDEPHDLLAIHPGGDERLPLVGVFALRVPARPNPIGVSAVRVLAVAANELLVRGLDAVDGTPVLDVKPYLPAYDSVPGATLPGWATAR